MRTIVLNSIRTPDGTVLISRHRHDFVTHHDKNGQDYAVDGGLDYLKRMGPRDYEDLSVHADEPFEKVRKNFYRGTKGKNSDEDLRYVALCDMTEEHLIATLEYIKENSRHTDYKTVYYKLYQKELEYRKVHEWKNV